jgi:hypothetical protein
VQRKKHKKKKKRKFRTHCWLRKGNYKPRNTMSIPSLTGLGVVHGVHILQILVLWFCFALLKQFWQNRKRVYWSNSYAWEREMSIWIWKRDCVAKGVTMFNIMSNESVMFSIHGKNGRNLWSTIDKCLQFCFQFLFIIKMCSTLLF